MSATLQACRAVTALAEDIESFGFTFEESDNFDAFKSTYEPLGRGPVNPAFDTTLHPISGFWLALLDGQGAVAAIQAVRHLGDCGPDLYLHLIAKRDDYVPLGSNIDPGQSEITSAAARTISGAGCYHGEFYILPRHRKRGLAGRLIRLAQLLAWARWSPDFFFGLTIPATSSQGFAERMGYGGFEQRAVIWRDERGTPVREEGLVWSDPVRFRLLVRDPFAGLSARLRRRLAEQ